MGDSEEQISEDIDPATVATDRLPLRVLQPLAEAVLAQYGISGARLKSLRYYNNVTYRVSTETGERYVLRVTPNFYSGDELRSEMLWLAALRQDPALHAPEPVAALEGSMVVTAASEDVPRPRLCVLFRWMDGAKVEEGQMNANHFRLAGEGLARMHRQSELLAPGRTMVRPYELKPQTSNLGTGFIRPSWDESRFLSAEMVTTREKIHAHLAQYFSADEVGTFVTLTQQARTTMRVLAPDPASFGLIHADFHAGNYLFHRGTVRFIDFEDSGWGYFLYDMATALFGIIGNADYDALSAAFFAGYARIRALPDRLAERLRQFQIVRCIFLTGLVVTGGSLDESKWWEGYVVGRLKLLLERSGVEDRR